MAESSGQKRRLSFNDSSGKGKMSRGRGGDGDDEPELGGRLVEQNKALGVALRDKSRQISYLQQRNAFIRRKHRQFVSNYQCVERHWAQLNGILGSLLASYQKTEEAGQSSNGHQDLSDATARILARLTKSQQVLLEDTSLEPFSEREWYQTSSAASKAESSDMSVTEASIEEDGEEDLPDSSSYIVSLAEQKCKVTQEILENLLIVFGSTSPLAKSIDADHSWPFLQPADAQLLTLKHRISSLEQRIRELTAEVEHKELERHRAFRELDRLIEGTDGHGGPPKYIKNSSLDVEQSTSAIQNVASSEPEMNTATSGAVVSDFEQLKDELEQVKELCEKRLEEVEQLRADKVALSEEINRMKSVPITDETIKKSRLYLELHGAFQQEKHIRSNLELGRDRFIQELAELKDRLKKKDEQATENDKASTDKWEAAARESQKAVQELKNECYSLKIQLMQVAEQASQMAAYRGQVAELKAHASGLESQVLRLKQEVKYAENKGRNEAKIAYKEEIDSLTVELEKARTQLKQHSERAESKSTETVREKAEQLEIKFIEASTALDALRNNYQETVSDLDNARAETNEFIAEVESIAEQYEAKQEHNKQLLLQIAEKDNANAQLMSEHIKLNQAQSMLKEELLLVQSKLERTLTIYTKQKELSATLEQSNAAKTDQIEHIEKQNTELNRTLEKQQLTLADLHRSLNRTNQQLEQLNSQHQEMQKRADDLARQSEKHAHQAKRADEEVSSLKKKLESAKSSVRYDAMDSESSEEKMLRTMELEKLRKMVKCSICKDRTKNVMISKCGHVFCSECIDENLRVRNRKCPDCRKLFGSDDVKPIWIT